MRFERMFALLVLAATPSLCLNAASPVAASLENPKQAASQKKNERRKPDVLVVADAFGEERASFIPTKEKPVYYVLRGGLEKDIGSPVAGVKAADPAHVRAELTKALASRHFVETKTGGPMPSAVLVFAWGYASLSTTTADIVDDETGESSSETVEFDDREKKRLAGDYKLRDQIMLTSDMLEFDDAKQRDRLYVIVSAFDAMAFRKKENKLLWRTRISIDAARRDLGEDLGVMLTSAAPLFGRDERRPVIIDDALRRHSWVDIGEAEVVEDVPKTPPAKTPQEK